MSALTFKPLVSSNDDETVQKFLNAFNEDIQNAIANPEKGGRLLSKAKGKIRKVSRKDEALSQKMQAEYERLDAAFDSLEAEAANDKIEAKILAVFSEIEEQLNSSTSPRRYSKPTSASKFIKKLEKTDPTKAAEYEKKIEALESRIEAAKAQNELDELAEKLEGFIREAEAELASKGVYNNKGNLERWKERASQLEASDSKRGKFYLKKIAEIEEGANQGAARKKLDALIKKVEENLTNCEKESEEYKYEKISTHQVETLREDLREMNDLDASKAKPFEKRLKDLLDRHNKVVGEARQFVEETLILDKWIWRFRHQSSRLDSAAVRVLPFEQADFDFFYKIFLKDTLELKQAAFQKALKNIRYAAEHEIDLFENSQSYVGLTSLIVAYKSLVKIIKQERETFYEKIDKWEVEFKMDKGREKPIISFNQMQRTVGFWTGVALLLPEEDKAKEFISVAEKKLKEWKGRTGAIQKTHQNFVNELDDVTNMTRGDLYIREKDLNEAVIKIFEKESKGKWGKVKRIAVKEPDWREIKHLFTDEKWKKVAPYEVITEAGKDGLCSVHRVSMKRMHDGEKYNSMELDTLTFDYRKIRPEKVRKMNNEKFED